MHLTETAVLRAAFAAIVISAALPPRAALAQAAAASAINAPAGSTTAQPDTSGLWQRSTLLGDIGGLRTALGNAGITLGLQTSNEAFANTTGGIKRGASADGMTMLDVTMDTGKALGLEGGTLNVSGLWIYGPDFSAGYLDNLQTVSGIAAQPTVRLWEAWYQQSFLGGKLDIKLGQQSADQEFLTSTGASLFLNAMMGWPILPAADLYAGGPAYPLSSLGVRLRAQPVKGITVLAGVFDDNPSGGPFQDDSQLRGAERYGAMFNLGTGALAIIELQYTTGFKGLAGTYKIGGWFDSGRFPDQRFDATGRSLAAPDSDGRPEWHWHDYSVYGVIDQTIWQPDPNAARAIALFARPMVAPADRNLINFSLNAGMSLKAPLPGRDSDSFGIGMGVANVSPWASALDRDAIAYSGVWRPVRGAETFLEVTYLAQVTPWLQVQPDFQYFWMPGGGVPDPAQPQQRIGNEAVFGVRSVVVF